MPIYEFQCQKCGKVFEELITDSKERVVCTNCQSKRIKKLVSAFSSPNIIVSALTIPEAGYSEASKFNEKLRKGELENPVKERNRLVKEFRVNSPLFKKGKK